MMHPNANITPSVMRSWNLTLLILIGLLLMGLLDGLRVAHAQENWSRFRGDRADGVAVDNAKLPELWDRNQNVAWAADVPGLGWSCPIVWGTKVFVTSVTSDEETTKPSKGLYLGEGTREPGKGLHHWWTICFDLNTGKELWRRETHTGHPTVPRHPKSSYAAETAATDGERVIVLFGDVGLYCYDFEGELQWSHPIEPKKTFYSYGAASSPVLHDGKVFVVYDNLEASWIAAFDAKSGEVLWKQDRQETKSWATPFVWKNDQRTEIVVPGQRRNRSYSMTGDLLWEFDGKMSSLVIPSPFAAHGLCYVSSGYIGDGHRPTFAIRPGAKGDISPGKDEEYTDNEYIAWYQDKGSPYNTTQLVYGDYLYTVYDLGFITCHHAKTGEEIYGKQRFSPKGTFTASPWAYNDYVFCLSEEGLTYVISAGPQFRIVRTNPLDEMALATPAVAQGKLLIRTASKLYCISGGERAITK